MSLRTALLLGLALVVAAGTALFARNWIVNERAQMLASMPVAEAPKALDTVRVLVARKPLAVGTFLSENLVEWRAWPEDGVGDGYVVEGEDEGGFEPFKGAVVRTSMTEGEPITRTRVVHPGDRGFLAAVLEPGQRAVAVPVNATSGIAGLVFPGDKVDVLLTVRMRGQTEADRNENRFFSETLLQGIRVLATDQTLENKDGEAEVAKTATLEVSPKQAEKVAVALEMGSLSLSLQSLGRRGDRFSQVAQNIGALPTEEVEARSYTLDMDVYHMLGDPRLFRPKHRGGVSRDVNVLRGAEASTTKF